MSGFAYPEPISFEDAPCKPSSGRKAPGRSKSNDEDLFTASNASKPSSGRFLPHSRSGRFLPMPKPKSNGSYKGKPAPTGKSAPPQPPRGRNSSRVGSAESKRKAPGKCQSSNLEYMRSQSASRQRERSLSPESSPEQPKKPSSLKKFLQRPKKAIGKTQSSNLEDMQRGLRSSNSAKNGRSSSRQKAREVSLSPESPEKPKKPSSLKQFLLSPRKPPGATKSSNLEFMRDNINKTTHSAPAERHRVNRARTKKKKPRDRDRSFSPERKKDKPLSFKTLLGPTRNPKRTGPTRSRSEDLDLMKATFESSPPASPVQRVEQTRERSLSPLTKEKPASRGITAGLTSGVTGFLDSLYDSIMDASNDGSDSDEDGYNSRFDNSFNKALEWGG
jgi:hypothetical protein